MSFQCIPVCRDIKISPQRETNRCNVRAVIIPPEKGSHSKTKPLIIIPLDAKAKKSKSNKMLRTVPVHRINASFDKCFPFHFASTSSPRPLIQSTISSREAELLNHSPSSQAASPVLRLCIFSPLEPIPLPPDVQNGIIVLPEKS